MAVSTRNVSQATRRTPQPEPNLDFVEVDCKHTSVAFRAYIREALKILAQSPTEIGRATFRLIASGAVKLDEMSDLTRKDYTTLIKDYAKQGDDYAKGGYQALRDGRSQVARALQKDLYGFMWDDRVYVAADMPPQRVARTLVHEINHVVNKSEENYRSHEAAFIEEYRAHYAERLFLGQAKLTPAQALKLKREILKNYKWPELSPSSVPDVPPGILIPKA